MRKREKRARKGRNRGIVDFMMVTHHFFQSLREWFMEMDDPRNQSYITYTQADLVYMGILKMYVHNIPCAKWKKILTGKPVLPRCVYYQGIKNWKKCPIMIH